MSQLDLESAEKLAEELGRNLKSEEEFEYLASVFEKKLLQTALDAEIEAHLGYAKHDPLGHRSGNNRNGKTKKTIKTENSQFVVEVPRDRNGSFEPQLIKKNQTRLLGLDFLVPTLQRGNA